MADKEVKIAISADGAKAEKGLTDVSQAARSLRNQVNDLSNSTGILTSIIGAGGLVAAMNVSIQATVQMERAAVGLAVTARYAGAGMEEANRAAQSLTKDGLMSVTEASQALQNLLSRGFSLKESIDLMNRFKDSAAFNRQAHLEFGQSIVGATEGLKNENSVLVDNAGVTKNVSVMWKEYAAQIGTSADKLTQSQKRQAEYNGILRETEGQLGNAARMSDTFSGAQSRFNQQLFEAKAALGTGLMSVMQGVLTMFGPIITGFRDMVYWVETLGARAGFQWEKLKTKMDPTISGGEANRRVANLQKLLDEQIGDIVRRADGGALPDIGRDSGKRRSDIVIPEKTKKTALSEGQRIALSMGKQQIKEFYDLIWQSNEAELSGENFGKFKETDLIAKRFGRLKYNSKTDNLGFELPKSMGIISAAERGMMDANARGEITPEQQAQFDLAAQEATLQARNEMAMGKEQEFMAMKAALWDEGHQLELWRMEEERNAWETSWAMETDSYAVYEERKSTIEAYYADRRVKLAENEKKNKLAISQSTFSNLAGAIDTFARISQGKNAALFRAYQLTKSAETIVATYSGAQKAFDDGARISYWVGLAYAASATVFGLSNLAAIWAVSPDSASGGSPSVATGVGYGSGTPSSPVVTQPISNNQGVSSIQIIINNPIGEKRWFEENLPDILKDFSSRKLDVGVAYA